MATSMVRRLVRGLMSFPADLARGANDALHQLQGDPGVPPELRRGIPSSLDSMSPNNKVLLAMAAIPPAPGVKCHSIIPVKGNGPPEAGNDGVVKYTSAHVDYADSELIVRYGHSCQDQPPAIQEVRRILLEHLAAVSALSGQTPQDKGK
jgi:hypothetical protein